MKIKISQNGKFVKLLPGPIAKRIREIAAEYQSGIYQLTYTEVFPDKEFYVGEGDRFIGLMEDGTEAQFEVVSGNTIGGSGLSSKIGSRFTMPENSFLIHIDYYGKYYMTVYNVCLPFDIPQKELIGRRR